MSPTEVNSADIIGRDGKAVAKESLGASIDSANARFSPLKLKTGDWPVGPEQVVIDAGTAEKQHYALGDSVRVSTPATTASYRITGTASYGDVDSLGFSSVAIWDVKTAQALLDREGRFDTISIAAKDGTSAAELVRAVRPLIPATLEVKDSAKQAEEASAEADKGMAYIRYFLLGFGAIALFVGAFVIFNTLSITVAQRTREFATLRTLGASRKQVLRSVRLEGLAIGLLASMIGLVLGFGIAKGMLVLFSAMGVDLPKGDTVFAPHTVVVSLLVGTGITLLATIVPARRATRVPPIAAVREGSTLPAGRLAPLAGRLVKPLVRLVGWPARRVGGVAGELAGANATRNPGRTASTAAALMIGLTLVTLVAVLGAAPERVDQGGRQRPAPRRLRPRRQRPAAVQRRRGRRTRACARREGRLARARRQGARAGRADRRQRHRPGHDCPLLRVRLGGRAPSGHSRGSGPTERW